MKRTSHLLLLFALGIGFQVQAASTNANPGTKPVQTVPQTQGNQGVGNTVETNEQNQVKNQGVNTQIQTQEQNAVETQDSVSGKANQGKSNSSTNPSVQNKSQVANAVQAMLQIADRNGGIGQQVRVIAQTQTQNQTKLEANVEKIQSRGGIVKFFVGPNYGAIKDAQMTLEQNREQIRQLNQIRTQLSNEGDQTQLTQQISVLEQANQEIETLLAASQSGFSLFGWLNKLVS
ncbi:MAG: hypothetical protein PHP25_05190 [Candidatus Moranbacteria bacterium]|nr:hypothetical protein [Candidatus Moranbacteria bacterium]